MAEKKKILYIVEAMGGGVFTYIVDVPFGYVWNKKGGQRWEIDPEAAPCVKKVFEWTNLC